MHSTELGIAPWDGVAFLRWIVGLRLTGERRWESQWSDSVPPCVSLRSDHILPGNFSDLFPTAWLGCVSLLSVPTSSRLPL